MAASAPRKKVPAKKAPPRAASSTEEVTSVNDWRGGRNGEKLTLPSGNVCLVRRTGIQHWLKMDIVPDSLRGIIDEAVARGKGVPASRQKQMMENSAEWPEYFRMMDRVVALTVIEPKVCFHEVQQEDGTWQEIPLGERDTDTYIYTDEVDLEDKMFIQNFAVGGVRDLERFRQEYSSGLGALRSS